MIFDTLCLCSFLMWIQKTPQTSLAHLFMSVSAQQLAMTHNYVIQAVNITSLSMTLWYSFITYCFHNKLATAGNYNFANSNSSVMSIAFYWRPMVGNYKLGQYVQSCQSSIDTFSSNIVPSTNYKLQIQSSKKVKCFNYWSGVIKDTRNCPEKVMKIIH